MTTEPLSQNDGPRALPPHVQANIRKASKDAARQLSPKRSRLQPIWDWLGKDDELLMLKFLILAGIGLLYAAYRRVEKYIHGN